MKRAFLPWLVLFLFSITGAIAVAEPYSVLTYNLGLLRAFGSDLVPMVSARAAVAPRELGKFAAATTPQIMLLEEVWRDAYAEAIAKELASLGYAAIRPNVHSILGLNSGLLLLVKPPLTVVDWKFTPFSRTTFMDSFARKGVLEATLENSETGSRFVLMGTHTVAVDTVNGTPTDKGQVDAIMAQADQILGAFRTRSGNGKIPALLLGDFNAGPGYIAGAYEKIAGYGSMRESGAVLSPSAPIITWDPNNPLVKYGNYPEEPAAKIDHVFLQDGDVGKWSVLSARPMFIDPVQGLSIVPSGSTTAVPSTLSDHYGFFTQVELNTGP